MSELCVQGEEVTARKTQAFYSKCAPFYHPLVVELFGYERVMRALLLDRNVLTSNMKVLDAGTGTGLMTRTLYSIANEKGLSSITYHAFDFTQAMLDVLRSWIRLQGAEGSISTRIQNVLHLETLPNPWDDYDLIVSSGMLEYVPPESLPEAIAGLWDHLKPGGRMILSFTGRTRLMRFFVGGLWRSNLYDESELEAILAKAEVKNFEFLAFPSPHQKTDGHLVVVEITRPKVEASKNSPAYGPASL